MNKKDRIAVVCSLLLVVIGLADSSALFFTVSIVLILYWGYRFILNDISFIKIKDKD